MALGQDAPSRGVQAQRVRQRLKHEIPFARAIALVTQRRQSERVAFRVGKPCLRRFQETREFRRGGWLALELPDLTRLSGSLDGIFGAHHEQSGLRGDARRK